MGSFKAELDATYAAPILYDCNIHFVRSEGGPNANPHWHRLLYCEKLSKLVGRWQDEFLEEANRLLEEYKGTDG